MANENEKKSQEAIEKLEKIEEIIFCWDNGDLEDEETCMQIRDLFT